MLIETTVKRNLSLVSFQTDCTGSESTKYTENGGSSIICASVKVLSKKKNPIQSSWIFQRRRGWCNFIDNYFLWTKFKQTLIIIQSRAPVASLQCLYAVFCLLTLTTASLVWAMSEMTPSVIISSTKYWEPSVTSAAHLRS